MTDPASVPPPAAAAPTDTSQRRKRIAIGINVVLLIAVLAAVFLVDRGDDTVEAIATGSTTTTTTPRRVDDSEAFVLGMELGTTTTTQPTATTSGENEGRDGEAEDGPATTTTTSTTTTTVAGPPELTGELDEDGIPIGLEFPLYNSEHTIIGGENLWLIAANQLAAITERELHEVSQTQIAVYWERVMDTNRSNLRSGNPDLVYPGEVVKFPGA